MKNIHTRIFPSILLLNLTLLVASSFASQLSLNNRGTLASVLLESSGLDYDGGNHFWSLNDSGNPNEIYCVSDNGTLTKTLTVLNASNADWEDLAHDAARNYMFIGDFGNNANLRTSLRIYRIPYPTSVTGNTVTADVITFNYPDQTSFPSPWLNFDSESFFHFQGQLYIFTKGYGTAMGYTKMYSLPDSPGNYTATLVDSFYVNEQTTSADISPDGSTVAILAYSSLHLFRNFTGADFFTGQHYKINFSGGWTQKEALSFSGNSEVYITDENAGAGNHIYYADLSAWIPPVNPTSVNKFNLTPVISAYPQPASEFVNIEVKNPGTSNVVFYLYNLTGKLVFQTSITNVNAPFAIRTDEFPGGVYFYKIYADSKEIKTSRLIISH